MQPSLSFLLNPRYTALLLVFGILANSGRSQAQQSIHTLSFGSAQEMKAFFKPLKGRAPVLAGHRGTVEDGFPENSIESFGHTLKHTAAIFEIDPRMTKDGVVILMHDETLDRTTTGSGKVSEHTYREIRELFLRDVKGNPTSFKAPTLEEVLKWARGKTVVNLDHKGVPYDTIAALIDRHQAWSYVMITTHSPEHALYYLGKNKDCFFSAHIKTPEVFRAYEKAGVPFDQMIAYIGPQVRESNQEMYRLLGAKGTMAMISSASTYDKLPDRTARKQAYRQIIADGAGVLESDFPIEAAEALRE